MNLKQSTCDLIYAQLSVNFFEEQCETVVLNPGCTLESPMGSLFFFLIGTYELLNKKYWYS